jgi:hypothetical protein
MKQILSFLAFIACASSAGAQTVMAVQPHRFSAAAGCALEATIAVTPSGSVYTGGVPTNFYIGYGANSANLVVTATGGTGLTYAWSPTTNLSNGTTSNPSFSFGTTQGRYTRTVIVTASNGCKDTVATTLCVWDIRDLTYTPVKGGYPKVQMCNGSGTTTNVPTNQVVNYQSMDYVLGECPSEAPCESLEAK